MTSVFLLQLKRLRRAPVLVLSFFSLTIIFVAVLAGGGGDSKVEVLTFSDQSLNKEEAMSWVERLNESDSYEFNLVDEEEAIKAVTNRNKGLALKLLVDDYRILIAADEPSRMMVDSYIQQVYREELRLRQLQTSEANKQFRQEVRENLEQPVLSLNTQAVDGESGSFEFNERLHTLFGMTLFFVIYTISYSLMNVAEEKRLGTWDRLITTPASKSQLYMGHLLYCFLIGYLQITLIFFLFHFAFGIDIGSRIGTILLINAIYTFTIVAVGILLLGLVRSSQQLQAIIPIVASGSAMLGGAFWPIETVTNEILLTLSKGMPIFYGLEALKGAAIYERSLTHLIEPLSILLLIGVVCMGVGMNLMERRR
ncbi:ABC transporter permease [Bacillus sp. FJAT-45037]|uniref:ABC transporter permease n=1 Tax=Bacillus sp. FJAT-45037 TaxID=2011007 RepID=UPI000C2318E6|nr:ABC transporter permease [Bacillus sp. FJAT-45037]